MYAIRSYYDYIEAQGYAGTVNSIQIFNTILKTPDNKTIIIPNGGLSTSSMVNYSTEPTRRVDWTFGIAYGDDIDKAKEVFRSLLGANEKVLTDPAPFVELSVITSYSIHYTKLYDDEGCADRRWRDSPRPARLQV